MELAVGIDVGFSGRRRSTGFVFMECRTRRAVLAPVVLRADAALTYLKTTLKELSPDRVVAAVDGPMAGPVVRDRVRLAEAFFCSGPFSGTAGRRLNPAPTRPDSIFLEKTRRIVGVLRRVGLPPMRVQRDAIVGSVIEVFPNLLMGVMLPPHRYVGTRSEHSDDLWLKLAGLRAVAGETKNHLAQYQPVIDQVERTPRSDRHDARAAAISAIAADMYMRAAPGSKARDATQFFGHRRELGFVMPPRRLCNRSFLTLLDQHWDARGSGLLRI